MQINLIVIGKTQNNYLKVGIEDYKKRLKSFINFNLIEIQDVKNAKNLSISELKNKEADLIKKYIDKKSTNYFLHEKGKQYTSVDFSKLLKNQMLYGKKTINFFIGGAFGFSNEILTNNQQLALSKMTFSHQMVRLIFLEQIYRAMTIIRGKQYHH